MRAIGSVLAFSNDSITIALGVRRQVNLGACCRSSPSCRVRLKPERLKAKAPQRRHLGRLVCLS